MSLPGKGREGKGKEGSVFAKVRADRAKKVVSSRLIRYQSRRVRFMSNRVMDVTSEAVHPALAVLSVACCSSHVPLVGREDQGVEGVDGAMLAAVRKRAHPGRDLSRVRPRRVAAPVFFYGPDGTHTRSQVGEDAEGVQGKRGGPRGWERNKNHGWPFC